MACFYRTKLFLLLLLLLSLNGCMATFPQTREPSSGTYRLSTKITYKLSHRTFLLHVPPGYSASQPLPLVIVLHGAFSTGRQTEDEAGFSTLADSERFLVVYPEGIGIFGLLQHWNAGHCCGKAADDGVDDVGFIADVIETTRQKVAVDPSRIYLAGMSNGGMLTYRFAVERPNVIAAAAVISGAIGSSVADGSVSWHLPETDRALPIIAFHGLADETIPANGGVGPRKVGERSYSSVAAAAEFWRKADGCGSEPTTTVAENGAVMRLVWDNCRDATAVEYNLLTGWGHLWPAPRFTDQLAEGDSLRGFDATKKIWAFFYRFQR